jgi:uncharacterized protein (AIM24 family)
VSQCRSRRSSGRATVPSTRTEISCSPAYAIATIHLDQGESVNRRSGRDARHDHERVDRDQHRGRAHEVPEAIRARGESFFMNTFTATGPDARVVVAPALPGDVITWPLTGSTVFLQSGSYLAAPDSVSVDSSWGGQDVLQQGGSARAALLGHRRPRRVELRRDPRRRPRPRPDLRGRHRSHGGAGGVGGLPGAQGRELEVDDPRRDGFVVDLTGPGRIYLQSRSPNSFIEWLAPKLPGNRS